MPPTPDTFALLPPVLASFLEHRDIAAHAIRTDEAAPTAEDAARLLGVPAADIVKTMVLTDGARVVAAIVPGDRRLDRHKVAAAAGSGRLRFATGTEVLAQTGWPPGGVAPFAFALPVTVIVDAALAADPHRTVFAGGGRPELLLRVAVADLVRHNDAQVASIVQDLQTS